jgi:hypothetical protein
MPSDFIALRQLEGHRVKMRFDDGIEVIARLNSVTQDFDESRHLVYDHVEWASDPQVFKNDAGKTFYTKGESLIAIQEWELPTQ